MDEYTVSQMELSVLLDSFVYLDNDVTGFNGLTLEEIIIQLDKLYEGRDDPPSEYLLIKGALDLHKEWKGVTLINQSGSDSTGAWTDELIQACTFVDGDGNYYVVYRGTGEGRWPDNGRGMTAPSTQMQIAAAAYFDYIAETYLLDVHANGGKIITSGHSKGGNESQYVYLASKYEHLIDYCFSFDGQGFSERAIEDFKEKYGEELYNEKLNNMYSICGQDDYVHDLGIVVIPEGNTYYVGTEGIGFFPWHHISYIFGEINEETGKWVYTGLHWSKEDGTIIHGEQGAVGKFTKRLSEFMMRMDPENRDGSAIAMMWMIDRLMNLSDKNWGIIGDVNVTFFDGVDFFAHGLPTVLASLLLTPEGNQLILSVIASVVAEAYNEHGVFGAIGAAFLAGIILVAAGAIIKYIVPGFVLLANLIDSVYDAIINLPALAQEIINLITQIWEAAINTINSIRSWITSKTAGYQYASQNPQIKVDTALLRGFADRLNTVNGRIARIDGRLDSLYWKVGLLDLWNLMQADLLTSYSWRLLRCSGYLNDTAREFESVERNLMEVN